MRRGDGGRERRKEELGEVKLERGERGDGKRDQTMWEKRNIQQFKAAAAAAAEATRAEQCRGRPINNLCCRSISYTQLHWLPVRQ